jgi:hypothetical protein
MIVVVNILNPTIITDIALITPIEIEKEVE